MKNLLYILLAATMLINVSCEEECDDAIKYKSLAREVILLDTELDLVREKLKHVDLDSDPDGFIMLNEELVDLSVMKAFVEIEMEILKRDSRCI